MTSSIRDILNKLNESDEPKGPDVEKKNITIRYPELHADHLHDTILNAHKEIGKKFGAAHVGSGGDFRSYREHRFSVPKEKAIDFARHVKLVFPQHKIKNHD